MTTIMPLEIRCAVCGKESKHGVLTSTNNMGPPDLDMRPAEMKRSTMAIWVQRGPHCGYCAAPIDEEAAGAAEVVASELYMKLMEEPAYPELARRFLCQSALKENAREHIDAGWSALYAAWACDDNGTPELAMECRRRASELFLQAGERRQGFLEDDGAEEALIADILRRCGRLKEAAKLCEAGLRRNPGDLVRSII